MTAPDAARAVFSPTILKTFSSPCWFATPRVLRSSTGVDTFTFTLPDYDWVVLVAAPLGGVTAAAELLRPGLPAAVLGNVSTCQLCSAQAAAAAAAAAAAGSASPVSCCPPSAAAPTPDVVLVNAAALAPEGTVGLFAVPFALRQFRGDFLSDLLSLIETVPPTVKRRAAPMP